MKESSDQEREERARLREELATLVGCAQALVAGMAPRWRFVREQIERQIRAGHDVPHAKPKYPGEGAPQWFRLSLFDQLDHASWQLARLERVQLMAETIEDRLLQGTAEDPEPDRPLPTIDELRELLDLGLQGFEEARETIDEVDQVLKAD